MLVRRDIRRVERKQNNKRIIYCIFHNLKYTLSNTVQMITKSTVFMDKTRNDYIFFFFPKHSIPPPHFAYQTSTET